MKNLFLPLLCLVMLSSCVGPLNPRFIKALKNEEQAIAIFTVRYTKDSGQIRDGFVHISPYGSEIEETTGPSSLIYEYNLGLADLRGFRLFFIKKPGSYGVKEIGTVQGDLSTITTTTYDIDDKLNFDISLGEIKYLGHLNILRDEMGRVYFEVEDNYQRNGPSL